MGSVKEGSLSMINDWLGNKLGTGINVLVKMYSLLEFYEKPIRMKQSLISNRVERALYYILLPASRK